MERSHRMYYIEQLYTLHSGQNHGLSKENLRKFQIKSKFWQLFWMKFMNPLTEFTSITAVAVVLLYVYISQVYDYYFIILVMFFLLSIYIIVKIVPTYSMGVLIIYCAALYLKLRFQQITKEFQRISAKNLDSLQSLIREHNRVTLMTRDCNIAFNKFLGVAYFYTPFIVNLLLCITIYGKSSLYIRIIVALLAIFTSIGMYLFSYIPTQVSTEAHRCYDTINSINARYKMKLETRFKVSFF